MDNEKDIREEEKDDSVLSSDDSSRGMSTEDGTGESTPDSPTDPTDRSTDNGEDGEESDVTETGGSGEVTAGEPENTGASDAPPDITNEDIADQDLIPEDTKDTTHPPDSDAGSIDEPVAAEVGEVEDVNAGTDSSEVEPQSELSYENGAPESEEVAAADPSDEDNTVPVEAGSAQAGEEKTDSNNSDENDALSSDVTHGASEEETDISPESVNVESQSVQEEDTTASSDTSESVQAPEANAEASEDQPADENTIPNLSTGNQENTKVEETLNVTPEDPGEASTTEKEAEEPVAATSDPEETVSAEATGESKIAPGDASGKKELQSEEDLSEKGHHDHHDHEDDHEEIDYSTYSKEQLVDLIKSLAKDSNIVRSDRIVREIKPLFDEIKSKDRAEALERFIADGGSEQDFEYKYDELTIRFDANYKLIRDRKSQYTHEKEQEKDANLIKKQEILERLRQFVDADETNVNFEDFKQIQNEWKEVGPIPGAHVKTLWANYNALVDRFYDNRSIYFELKELDRRKNLEAKLELCERAEKLAGVEHIKDAITELNELHHEFKHIGPVPKDEQEAVWQRFKAASDAVYDRRKGFVERLKHELEANLRIKEQLAEDVQVFTSFDSDRIKEWNARTRELLDIQRKWEATGGLPRAKAKEINKKFWGAFKTFFNNKGGFFKKLDAQREGNMEQKQELVKRAEELKDSTEWNKTADEFKKLQRQWKEIGPVPEKFRESIYQEFKKACDHFFDKRRENHGQVEKEFEENYRKKLEICTEIVSMAEEKSEDVEKFRDLQEAFNDVGFVPRKNISEIKTKYAEAVDKYINSLEHFSSEEKQSLRVENQINKIIGGPNAGQKIHRKEQSLRKQISQVENDIAVWKNNMEFFAQSKKADKLKDEFQSKINSANNQLKNLKEQLKVLRTVS